jgi:hypothetical protein
MLVEKKHSIKVSELDSVQEEIEDIEPPSGWWSKIVVNWKTMKVALTKREEPQLSQYATKSVVVEQKATDFLTGETQQKLKKQM